MFSSDCSGHSLTLPPLRRRGHRRTDPACADGGHPMFGPAIGRLPRSEHTEHNASGNNHTASGKDLWRGGPAGASSRDHSNQLRDGPQSWEIGYECTV